MSATQKQQIPSPTTHKGWNYDSYFKALLKSKNNNQSGKLTGKIAMHF